MSWCTPWRAAGSRGPCRGLRTLKRGECGATAHPGDRRGSYTEALARHRIGGRFGLRSSRSELAYLRQYASGSPPQTALAGRSQRPPGAKRFRKYALGRGQPPRNLSGRQGSSGPAPGEEESRRAEVVRATTSSYYYPSSSRSRPASTAMARPAVVTFHVPQAWWNMTKPRCVSESR